MPTIFPRPPLEDGCFSGVNTQRITIKLTFASAKGFIHFAFCILNFAFQAHR